MAATAGLTLIRGFEACVRRVHPDRAFHDTAEYPWVKNVEARWREAYAELCALLSETRPVPAFERISQEQARLVRPDTWRTFILYTFGNKVEANCRRCPKTAALLESIPGMTLGMFSILTPGARIARHRGIYNGVLRYHLALMVPSTPDRCGIRIGAESRVWEQGKSLIFDDTLEHEAWNDTAEPRVVLFVDFLRDLPGPLGWWNRGMMRLIGASPYAQNMLVNLARLEADIPGPNAPGA